VASDSGLPRSLYDLDPVAEIYDRVETQTGDIALLKRLIEDGSRLRVLEPFAGTGRIVIPLAMDGHAVTGLELADAMVRRAAAKVAELPADVQKRITFRRMDALRGAWPAGFDLVVLAGNCLYELATSHDQEAVIRAAADALRPGGALFVDNDHMEGPLAPDWRDPGAKPAFPTGRCADGTVLESTMETVWTDVPGRLARFRRRVRIRTADGRIQEWCFIQQKHAPSAAEVRSWLEGHGLSIEGQLGDYQGAPCSQNSERAIFWARKERDTE
jgi:SAM-dependent methyltransferase